MVGHDDAALAAARDRVRAELDDAALLDAVGVVSNFERMTRIADATGIPLDAGMAMMSAEVRDQLALDRFAQWKNR